MKHIGTTNLIWQGDVRVSTFASGLVLVQRSAVCRSSDNKRNEIEVGEPLPAENTPAIDGLFIFPAPQESRTVAHTTYEVSAYGRTSNQPIVTKQARAVATPFAITDGSSGTVTISAPAQNQSGVIASSEDVPIVIPTEPPILKELWVDNNGITFSFLRQSTWNAAQISRTNYGAWDEYVISWETVIPDPGIYV